MKDFHPAVAEWFGAVFAEPTAPQKRGWPAIARGESTLILAPTGSGKTLTAFLWCLDRLLFEPAPAPPARCRVLYVSPLKALSNDIRINLEVPIEGIRAQLREMDLPDVEIRAFVRTGDTPQAEREQMKRRAPHIVVTTPESLYILLGSESGRSMLATARTVIVDEIHAMLPDRRGAHLALSLERLDALGQTLHVGAQCGGIVGRRSRQRKDRGQRQRQRGKGESHLNTRPSCRYRRK